MVETCILAGTEAMFADLGHFIASSIRLAFGFFVYPCLVIQYNTWSGRLLVYKHYFHSRQFLQIYTWYHGTTKHPLQKGYWMI
ncbi:hypothetical protein L6452_08001 [Arctium lappa]|uniref:Uncharacterized protein n=1 Tax=Arctium lappa TaxID=4217 RepID=A0ACB9DGP7_ARCLA|nr:hypothetical protein L6452_08001 [Arctium lappa]